MKVLSKLESYSQRNITLFKALEECANLLKNGIALLYSPQKCQFTRFKSGKLYELYKKDDNNYQERAINLKEYMNNYIFEARIFNENYELRWLNEKNGIGRSAVIFDNNNGCSQLSAAINWKSYKSLEYIKAQTQNYLIWGKKTLNLPNQSTNLDNWQILSSARIGSINVPLINEIKQKLTKDKRVYLKTCEYLQKIDDYGNVTVIEERLIKLEVM